MRERKSLWSCLFAGVLVSVAACGGGSDETAETVAPAPTLPASTAPVTTAPVTTAPSTTSPSTTAPVTTAPSTTAPSEQPDTLGQVASGALELLRAGFAAFDEPRPFRVSTVTAQTLSVPAIGADSVSDPDEPTVVVEVMPNGDSHTLTRIGQLLAPLASGDPEVAAQLAEVELEIWVVGDLMTIDATDYQVVADLNPAADFGPFAPGIGTIDLSQLGEIGAADVAALLVGSSVPDPAELGRSLPAALTSLQQDPADPSRFDGTTTYAAMMEAQGGDIEQNALATAAGIAANFGVDAEDLAAFYVDFYEQLPTQLTLELDDAGAVQRVTTSAELSGIWDAIFDDGSPITAGASDREIEQARSQFAGSVWTMRTETTFEIDDTIEVVAPVGDFEDRTQIAVDFFDAALGG